MTTTERLARRYAETRHWDFMKIEGDRAYFWIAQTGEDYSIPIWWLNV